ncbi:MAG: CopG family transcriptional regulator, partial [Chloroflexi bacterium RBG_16_57_9]
LTLDEATLEQVDKATQKLGKTRSAFIRDALNQALQQLHLQELERQHAEGYARYPIQPGEFDVWEDEQA